MYMQRWLQSIPFITVRTILNFTLNFLRYTKHTHKNKVSAAKGKTLLTVALTESSTHKPQGSHISPHGR